MAREVPTIALNELCDRARGITYGIVQPGTHADDGVPILRADNIENGRVVATNLLQVSREVEASYSRSRLRGGEILVTLVGAYFGKVAIAREEHVGMNTARAVGVVPVHNDNIYISYALRSPSCQHHFHKRATTTAQPTLNLRDLCETPIPWPPEPIRDAIARILGALDDKIDLNRKMNATLEAMARALFKSWFVDFDPVRAKAEGRAPSGMDAETGKLFPNEFIASEAGRMPKGWRLGNVGDVAASRRDTVHPKDVLSGSVYVGLEHLPRGRVFFEESGTPDELGSLKARFSQGEVLFGKLRPYFRKVAFAPCSGICSTDILVLSPRPQSGAFVALLAASDPFIEHAVALSDGTKMPRTSWEQLMRFDIVVPPDIVLQAFERQLISFFRRAEAGRRESATLACLRDELLPRMLSGELSVGAAERTVEEVA